jgi:hypothetical protein
VKIFYIYKEKEQKDYLVFVAVTSDDIKDCTLLLAVSEMRCCTELIATCHVDYRYMRTQSSM